MYPASNVAGGGLSPLARGTRPMTEQTIMAVRFIPAGAGNTAEAPDDLSEWAVYPRWRGEHQQTKKHHESKNGLSPLARGTLQYNLTELVIKRFIPAGAGNTSLIFANEIERAVYPRWRGEHG